MMAEVPPFLVDFLTEAKAATQRAAAALEADDWEEAERQARWAESNAGALHRCIKVRNRVVEAAK
jgi:hypothetical protein